MNVMVLEIPMTSCRQVYDQFSIVCSNQEPTASFVNCMHSAWQYMLAESTAVVVIVILFRTRIQKASLQAFTKVQYLLCNWFGLLPSVKY